MKNFGISITLSELQNEAVYAQNSAATTAPPEAQLRDAMARAGVQPPSEICIDGKLHRFATGPKRSDKSGWYIAYSDTVPAGAFGCWRTLGQGAVTWRADVGRVLSYAEEQAFAVRQANARAAREAENARAKTEGAARAKARWEGASTECDAHPYLLRKQIRNPGCRLTPDGCLISPMLIAGEIVGIQSIDSDGVKKFDYGSTSGGAWWCIGGGVAGAAQIYIAEGVATAASIYSATGAPVAVAYSAGNLLATARAVRAAAPMAEVVVVADRDASGVGERRGTEAALAVGGRAIVMPEWPGRDSVDANDYAVSGGDLGALLGAKKPMTERGADWEALELEPPAPAVPAEEWLVAADDFSSQPAPIKWLVKGWLSEQSLIMVHGPSGGGKTFVVLDWVLRIASCENELWGGARVKNGEVVYLAGEGHQGLRGRIAGWKAHNSVAKLSMWLTRGGCDLNTPEGYLQVKNAITAKGIKPKIIVVDTLHRFLAGDENKAQDVKTMLDACAALMRDFGCSVLLVHHTGVGEEAQHRGRGSSAWRGALDVEISISPGKDGQPLEIIQKKSKDAKEAPTIGAALRGVDIPGWLDEDGERVTTAVIEIDPAHTPRGEGGGGGRGHGKAATARPTKAEEALHRHKQTMREAWAASGSETAAVDGGKNKPYLTRSALLNHLTTTGGMAEKTAENTLSPNGNMMRQLLQNGFCYQFNNGWVITDNDCDGGAGEGGPVINIGEFEAGAATKNRLENG